MGSNGMFLHGELTEISRNIAKVPKFYQMTKPTALLQKNLENSFNNSVFKTSLMTA
jgi:hypothetical protein